MAEKGKTGLNMAQLNRLTGAIRKDIESELYDGGVILVARHGDTALHEAVGFAERDKSRICRKDDVFKIMSITKVFTDVILLAQIERGDLALTTRVTDIIPEFKGGFKEQVTVFHLLTHSAGAPPIFFPIEPLLVGDHRKVFEASCQMGLTSVPGEKVNYSSMWGHVILGEILRRVDGGKRALRDIFQEELFGPLKMKDTALGMRNDLAVRAVPIIARGNYAQLVPGLTVDVFNQILDENAEIPAWGAVSTSSDLFRFAEMLRNGGQLDGVRILSPVTIETATTIHTGSLVNENLSFMFAEHGWPKVVINTGFDFIIQGNGCGYPSSLGTLTSPRTFGKFGAGSTGFWVDPVNDVTFIFLSVGFLDEYYNFLRFQRFSDMAITAVV